MEGYIIVGRELIRKVQQITCKNYGEGDLVRLEELIEMVRDLVEEENDR